MLSLHFISQPSIYLTKPMELYSQQDPLVLNSSTESLGMFSSILRGKKTCVYLREKLLCRTLIRDGLDARKKGGMLTRPQKKGRDGGNLWLIVHNSECQRQEFSSVKHLPISNIKCPIDVMNTPKS